MSLERDFWHLTVLQWQDLRGGAKPICEEKSTPPADLYRQASGLSSSSNSSLPSTFAIKNSHSQELLCHSKHPPISCRVEIGSRRPVSWGHRTAFLIPPPCGTVVSFPISTFDSPISVFGRLPPNSSQHGVERKREDLWSFVVKEGFASNCIFGLNLWLDRNSAHASLIRSRYNPAMGQAGKSAARTERLGGGAK